MQMHLQFKLTNKVVSGLFIISMWLLSGLPQVQMA